MKDKGNKILIVFSQLTFVCQWLGIEPRTTAVEAKTVALLSFFPSFCSWFLTFKTAAPFF